MLLEIDVRRRSHVLPGRAREHAAAERCLDGLAHGQTATIAFSGEPGIGKTAVLRALAGLARVRGLAVLEACANAFDRDVALGFLDDALSALGQRRQGAVPITAPARHRERAAVRAAIEALASGGGGLVCVLDDLQCADATSLELIAQLIRRPIGAPLLLALAYRPLPRSGELCAALENAVFEGRAELHELGPLSRAEAADAFGIADGAHYAAAGGNPLYLRALHDGAPAAIAASVAFELLALPSPARRLAAAAAVLAQPVELELACEVARLEEPACYRALDALVASGLIRRTGLPGRYAFRHPVVRAAVEQEAGEGWRLELHRRAVERQRDRGADATVLAPHLEHAARLGDADAVAALREAAVTVRAHDPQRAARWERAAQRLTVPEPAARDANTAGAGALAAPGAARDVGLLSPREREIARLIAHGQRNREIAARLHLSVRTVESHVSNILGKLDVSTRASIAALAAATTEREPRPLP